MAIVKYGLSRDGFKRKRLPEIIKSLNSRVADKLGIPIQTGSNSIFGQLHGIYAYELADLWEQAESVYNAMYPHTANGTSLSNATALAGISLIDAEQTTLVATCYGSDNTKVPYGSQIASGSDSELTFSCTDTDAYISAGNASYAELILPSDVVVGTRYSITMSGTKKSYTVKTGDTKAIVLTSIASQFEFVDRSLSVSNNVLTIAMTSQKETFSIVLENLSTQNIGSPVNFICNTYGSKNPAIGEVNQITTTYYGWTGVKNNMAASVGRDAETDISLRQRWSSSVYERAAAMTDAIAAAIYSNVEGVTAVKVYENASDTTDIDSRPPHSIEAVVEGGMNEDIAKQIWNRKSGGIDTYGAVSIDVKDSQGITQNISFNRPEKIKIWMKIIIGENPEETFPQAGLQEILDAVLKKSSEQEIGQDVILQRYFATIFSATKGIGYINITACTGDTVGTYTASNIVISPRQIAVFDKSRIEVAKQ